MLIFFGQLVVIAPVLLLAVFGVTTLFRINMSERAMARCTEGAIVVGLCSALIILCSMLATDRRLVTVPVGEWVRIPDHAELHTNESHQSTDHGHPSAGNGKAEAATPAPSGPHFHFRLKFLFDRLSVPFVIMTYVLCGVISAFASRYLHRDEGFHRFFIYFSFFLLGMILSSLAGTIETLFFGWELVGLSSALLVAFFHDRQSPVRNGLRVWSVYRIADASFLVAAITLHHLSGSGDFSGLTGITDQLTWPSGKAAISEGSALFVGCLLLFAAAGKSALVPFSGWLPRAMEGPTPSSAVFYGALSVHLGAFLLLRVSPLLDESLVLSILVTVLGAVTCLFAAMTARVQTDIKSGLAFASLIQVSIIVVEIGLGFRYIPLIHIIGHACLRTLQLVRAPSLLRDYNSMINAIGDYLPETHPVGQSLSQSVRTGLYRLSFERGNLDAMLDAWFVQPFVRIFKWSDRMERAWTRWLSGEVQSMPVAEEDSGNGSTSG